MNLKHLILFFAVFAIVYAFNDDSVKGIEFLPNFLPKFAGNKYCATEDIYKWKKAMRSLNSGSPMADCQIEGVCDNFQERNKWNNAPLNIKLFITVICFSETSCPGNVDRQKVEGQISQINKDFNATNISFSFDESSLQFVVDATYAEIAAYSNFNSLWYTQLLGLKTKYAHKPTEYLNIFVTGQRSGSSGTLLGIGTFPWDPEALQAVGGLWVNANYWGLGEKTASHEIGHNVGLWHTFHGDSEVRCTDACYEVVHQDSGDDTFSNTVGDFCADTPAQPMNYYCSYPTGSDCKGNRYTLYGNNPALINNFMAYTPDSCMQYFTNQQSMRAACWICDRAWQWVEGQCPRK